jgi:RNA polymerase sigma-70 factor (ECF subfamily)
MSLLKSKFFDSPAAEDTKSFWQLIHQCERMVYRVALRVVRNEADAEEVVQEAMLKACCSFPGFRGECKFSTWLVHIVINEARLKLRKNRRHIGTSLEEGWRIDDGDHVLAQFPDRGEKPLEALERRELRDTLAKAVISLPRKYRSVFILRDVEEYTTKETANALGVSHSCVKIRLLRARIRMRNILPPECGVVLSRPAL